MFIITFSWQYCLYYRYYEELLLQETMAARADTPQLHVVLFGILETACRKGEGKLRRDEPYV